MEASEVNGQLRASNERVHPQRPVPPKPPRPYNSIYQANENTLANGDSHKAKKPSNTKDRPAFPPKTASDGGHGVLARAGETVLETFYGMLYKCEDDTKEWKLAADGFIPIIFIQEQGNANKPFKVIAAHGSVRVLEYPVTSETKCTQNKAFVRWNESNKNIFGVRFSKESQADQFHSAMSRMKTTLLKTAELFKQPERKGMVAQKSDRAVDVSVQRKTSLIIKLPNKETTVMSVPGSITMGELFEHVCKKEGLSSNDHQLSVPKIGSKELKFQQETVLGTLKIREISINTIDKSPSDSPMVVHESSKENKVSNVKTPVIPQPYAKQDERPTTRQTTNFEKKAESFEGSKNSPLAKPDPVKVKRRAPPPPQRNRPPERPKSMPVARPRNLPVGPATSPGPPQAKKRQAPARPPAPKKVLRDLQNNNETSTSNMKRSVSAERLPPIFCPPPPPEDIPPPLDECENPVSPLSDDDLHDTAWTSSIDDHGSSEVTSPSSDITELPQLTKDHKPSESGKSEDFPSPEPIPLKFLLPSSESPAEDADDLNDREGVSSRISFVGDSRSSSVDITSDTELPISPILESYKSFEPIECSENVPIATDISAPEQDLEPQSISPPPPPLDFSSEPLSDKAIVQNTENIESPEYDIEHMVIPPPPLMFDDDTELQEAALGETDELLDSDVTSIPPPLDFAAQDKTEELPAEFGDQETLSSKKKLGLDNKMFPWLTETQPVFNAEIKNSFLEKDIGDPQVPEVPKEKTSFNEEYPQVPEMPKEKTSFNEEYAVSATHGSINVPQMEPPLVESNEQLKVESSNSDHMSTISNSHVIETPDLYKDIPQQPIILNNDEEDQELHDLEPDQMVPDSQEVSVPETFKDEYSQHLNEPSHRTETSSESSSSTFKTPFDDLESIDYSEGGSLNSELEEDMFDLKGTTLKDKDSNEESTTSEVVSDSFAKAEPPLKEKDMVSKEETREDHSQGFSKTELSQIAKVDESKDDSNKKSFEEANASENSVGTKAEYSISAGFSENNVTTEEVIESSDSTSIAVPVDILFQSNSTSKETNLKGDDKDKTQVRLKRPVSSGFKTQSWADIKNREKEIEKQRQQNNVPKSKHDTSIPKTIPLTQYTTTPIKSTVAPSTVVNDTETLKSSNLTSSLLVSSSNDKLSSSTEVTSKSTANVSSSTSVQSTQSTSTSVSTSTTSNEKYPFNAGRRKPNYVESAHFVDSQTTISPANIMDSTSAQVGKKSGSSSQRVVVEPKKTNYVVSAKSSTTVTQSSLESTTENPSSNNPDSHSIIFPSMLESSKRNQTSPQFMKKANNTTSSEEVSKTDDKQLLSSEDVVMRQKTERPDSAEKRKSVHDMMRMFQNPAAQENRERSDSNEGLPRQSPALRLIEEKINHPYRQSSLESTEIPKSSDSRLSEKENESAKDLPQQSPVMRLLEEKVSSPNRSSTITSSITKTSISDSKSSEEKTNEETKPSPFRGFVEVSRSETKRTDEKPRTSSLNQRKSYGVLFPREYKPPSQTPSTTIPKETEASDTKPRTNSLNPRQKYDILFPNEQDTSDAAETNTLIEPKTQDRGTSDLNHKETKRQSIEEKISITKVHENKKVSETDDKVEHKQPYDEEASSSKSKDKKEIASAEKSKQRRSVDESVLTKNLSHPKKDDTPNTGLVIKRKKESMTVSDASKRHSMPVHLMESAPSSQSGQSGGNLKILLAPQITDVNVVPKGRVAAMMANWKKDDQQ